MTGVIKSGMTAPDFVVEDIFGGRVQLNSSRGRKVLLAFFRNSACAVCNLRVHQLIQRWPEWQESGLSIIAVFESPIDSMKNHVGKQDTPFSLIADPQAQLYKLYGVEVSEEKMKNTMDHADTQEVIADAAAHGFILQHEEGSNFHRMPAEFLINSNGIIHQAHYSEIVFEHLPLEIIDAFVSGV